MVLPSGLKMADHTKSSWRIGEPIGAPLRPSHNRRVPPPDFVTMVVPSGLKVADPTPPSWRRADFETAVALPTPTPDR